MDGENLYETYKNLTQNCYTVANSAIKITSSDTTSFSILSKNLATSVEHILEHVNKIVCFESSVESTKIVKDFLYAKSTTLQTKTIQLLKSSKLILNNPHSFLAHQKLKKNLEIILDLIIAIAAESFLIVKIVTNNQNFDKKFIQLFNKGKRIGEIAHKLTTRSSTSGNLQGKFNLAVQQFSSVAKNLIKDNSLDDDLKSSGEQFLLWTHKQTQEPPASVLQATGTSVVHTQLTQTKSSNDSFQKLLSQSKIQLISAIELIFIAAVQDEIVKFSSKDENYPGIFVKINECFFTLEKLSKIISADSIFDYLSSEFIWFQESWRGSSSSDEKKKNRVYQAIVANLLPDLPDFAKKYQENDHTPVPETKSSRPTSSSKKNLTSSGKQLKSALASTQFTPPPLTKERSGLSRMNSEENLLKIDTATITDISDMDKGPATQRTRHNSVIAANMYSTTNPSPPSSKSKEAIGRTREKTASSKFRSLLRKKPSILDDLSNDIENSKSRVRNKVVLQNLSNLNLNSIHDANDIEIKFPTSSPLRSSNPPSPALDRNLLSQQELFSTLQSFMDSNSMFYDPIPSSRETIKEKMNVVMKSMEILSGLNMWASGNRISKLPPSKVDKIEVTFVQQNYLLLSKKPEPIPSAILLQACKEEGMHYVVRKTALEVKQYKFLLFSILKQLFSFCNLLIKDDLSQTTFFMFASAITRYVETLGLLFQAEDNYCLLLEEGHNQQVVEKLQTIPLWEETRTRSKFDVESPKTLKSGTINSFIEALTDVWVVETRFNDTFFLTYRSFFSPMSLLNKLLERFDVPQEYHRERNKIQNRVLIALIQWIKDYFDDFDATMLNVLRKFLAKSNSSDIVDSTGAGLIKQLSTEIDSQAHAPRIEYLSFVHSHVKELETACFLGLDSEKIAQMICLIDADLYNQIDPTEFLQGAWSKPKYRYRSIFVTQLIHRLNRFTTWIASMIVWPETLKQRTEVIEKFIRIGLHLKEMNNFHSLMGISAAWNISAVVRLKHTIAAIKKRANTQIKEITSLLEPTGSWKVYRSTLDNVRGPAVPYLGIFLTDLTFIEDGNKTLLEDGKINFSKQKLVSKIFNQVKRYQQQKYEFTISHPEYTFVREFSCMPEETLYKLSLRREPRDSNIKDIE